MFFKSSYLDHKIRSFYYTRSKKLKFFLKIHIHTTIFTIFVPTLIMASIEQEIKQSKFGNELLKANINILFTANWLYNRISASLKPYNVTHEQFNVLRILKGSHPKTMCQKDILSRMLARNSNVTLIIKKLVDKKLILVEQSEEDRRQYVISITKSGLDLLKVLDKSLKKMEDTGRTLSESEAFHLNALLDKLRSE